MLQNIILVCIAISWVLDKCGIFAWISKFVHSRLPREKSMAIESLTGPLDTLVILEPDDKFVVIKSTFKIVDNGVVDVENGTFHPFVSTSRIHVICNSKKKRERTVEKSEQPPL